MSDPPPPESDPPTEPIPEPSDHAPDDAEAPLDEAHLLGRKLWAHRRARNLTQKDVAERLGWSQTKVSFLESGRRLPSEEDLLRLRSALEIPFPGDWEERERAVTSGLRRVAEAVAKGPPGTLALFDAAWTKVPRDPLSTRSRPRRAGSAPAPESPWEWSRPGEPDEDLGEELRGRFLAEVYRLHPEQYREAAEGPYPPDRYLVVKLDPASECWMDAAPPTVLPLDPGYARLAFGLLGYPPGRGEDPPTPLPGERYRALPLAEGSSWTSRLLHVAQGLGSLEAIFGMEPRSGVLLPIWPESPARLSAWALDPEGQRVLLDAPSIGDPSRPSNQAWLFLGTVDCGNSVRPDLVVLVPFDHALRRGGSRRRRQEAAPDTEATPYPRGRPIDLQPLLVLLENLYNQLPAFARSARFGSSPSTRIVLAEAEGVIDREGLPNDPLPCLALRSLRWPGIGLGEARLDGAEIGATQRWIFPSPTRLQRTGTDVDPSLHQILETFLPGAREYMEERRAMQRAFRTLGSDRLADAFALPTVTARDEAPPPSPPGSDEGATNERASPSATSARQLSPALRRKAEQLHDRISAYDRAKWRKGLRSRERTEPAVQALRELLRARNELGSALLAEPGADVPLPDAARLTEIQRQLTTFETTHLAEVQVVLGPES